MRETWVQSLGREDPPEKEMATHASILAWGIPGTEEPGGLQSTRSQRVWHDWETSLHFYDKYPKAIVGSYSNCLSFFFFKRIAILFSRVAVPFYIPSSYVYNPVFAHSHQFVVHPYFLLSHSDM